MISLRTWFACALNKFKLLANKPTNPKILKTVQVKWFNYFKLNIDGTLSSITSMGGPRGVFRNHNGDWILEFSYNMRPLNHTHAELLALKFGL